MNSYKKIYTFTVYGALGGLVGSLLHQTFFLDLLTGSLTTLWRLSYLALLGVFVGGSIGFFPSFAEGRGNYSTLGAIRSGLWGAFFGALGGSVALPLAEMMHVQLGGGVLGRVSALAFLGLMVGVAESFNGGARRWRGIAGGLAGGVVAGLALEALLSSQATYAASGIVALLLIGSSIAFFISLFVNVLADATLEGMPGSRFEGCTFHLGKFREPDEALLGSANDMKLFIWIPGAQQRHAAITLTSAGARLRHVAPGGETLVDGNPVRERVLRDGEVIEIARAQLKYREKRGAAAAAHNGNGKRPKVLASR
ncbi:MAG TPA: hypothetical protein VEY09_07015 [Pyrinomonadaceae bacterium]|nr:hypothetical protein [Pyrinomonadaceae bacterium]